MSTKSIMRCCLSSLSFILGVFLIIGVAPAFADPFADFEVDADLTSSTKQDWDSGDYNALISDSDPLTISPNDDPPAAHDNPGQPGTAALSYDYISPSGLVDSNIFTGGSKETLYDPLSELMNWDIVSGNIPPNKDDVSLVYTWKDDPFENLVAAMERLNTLGDAHLNFGLDHKPWKPCPNGTATLCRDPSEGDLLLVFDLKGTTPTARLFIWEEPGGADVRAAFGITGGTIGCDGEITGGGNLKKSCVDSKTGADRRGWEEIFPIPANTVEILTNSVDITAGPWGSFGPGGSIRNTIPAGAFFEVYVNLQDLGFEPVCPVFGVFSVRSRASESIDSELKDLAGPIELGLVCPDIYFCADNICDEDTGECVQTDKSAAVCPPDAYFCADNACSEATDQCVQTDKSATVCPPDAYFCADNACSEATDQCVQTDKSATVCPPDAYFCADNACDEGANACIQTDKSATVCPDTVCTVCNEDLNQCVDKEPLPLVCIEEAICRTPGFWGTHGCPAEGCEQQGGSCAQNITQAVINSCDGCLEVCGEVVNNTLVNDADSAIEAICVSPAGDIRHQLASQLTAMALNCCVSGFGSYCSGDPGLYELFSICNASCPDGDPATVEECIFRIDCFNNGGSIVLENASLFCQTGTCLNGDSCNDKTPCADLSACEPLEGNCHDREIPFAQLGLLEDCNSTGSSNACNAAIGSKKKPNNCALISKPSNGACSSKHQGEECCATGTKSDISETCAGCAVPDGPFCPYPTAQPPCGPTPDTCSSLRTVDGSCFCHQFIGCDDSNVTPCSTNEDCLPGWACSNSCCGENLCHPPCGPGLEGFIAPLATPATGGMTSSGSQ